MTIGDDWRYSLADQEAFVSRHILELEVDSDRKVHKKWVSVRPVPIVDRWFENVWREYRNGTIFEEAES